MKTQTTTRQTRNLLWMALAIAGLLSACGEDVAISESESILLEQASIFESAASRNATATGVTFKLEGLSELPEDLRLKNLALRGMELRLIPEQRGGDEVVIALDDLFFDVQSGEDEVHITSPITLPTPGLYQVRMQARADVGQGEEEQGEDTSSGLSFAGWMNSDASVPFDVRVFDDSRGDGPNPHPFDGGDDGKPSQPGGDDDPVASGDGEERGDGPNPHPFDGGDDGKPSPPGGDDDPVASGEQQDGPNPHPFDEGDEDDDQPVRPPGADSAEAGTWTALAYQDDGSTALDMGSIRVEEGDSTLSLSIFLPSIEATPAQLETAPSLGEVLNFSWGIQNLATITSIDESAARDNKKGQSPQQVQHLGAEAHKFIEHGRIY